MNGFVSCNFTCFFAHVLTLSFVGVFSACGGGTVTNCTQTDLEAALVGGGTVTFACDGVITLSSELQIIETTALMATGHSVRISGNNLVRLFKVAPGVNFAVTGLSLADGRVIGANGSNGDPPAPGQDAMGAAILMQGGSLTLNDCEFTNHNVVAGNAGQDLSNPAANNAKGGAGFGAAICCLGGSLNMTLTNVQAADQGAYDVVVTNMAGSVTSDDAVLTVDSTPHILLGPVSVVVAPGAQTNFSVTGDGPLLTYQWWHDGSPINNATNSSLIIASAMAGAQGAYFAVVANFAGSATSSVATLTFDDSALKILVQPANQTVEAGYTATFDVLVSGISPIAYQWYHEDAPIAGATGSALTVPSVTPNDVGGYHVVVTNGYKLLTSSTAQLTVTPGATPPVLSIARAGANLNITLTAQAGRTYRLLASSNLTSWGAVATNHAATAGTIQFVRPNTLPAQFYRVVTP